MSSAKLDTALARLSSIESGFLGEQHQIGKQKQKTENKLGILFKKQ